MPNLAAAATASRRSQAVAERTTTPHGRIELDTVGLHFKSKALEQRFRSFFFWTSAPTTSIIFLALALCEVTTLVLDVVINDSRGVDGMDDVARILVHMFPAAVFLALACVLFAVLRGRCGGGWAGSDAGLGSGTRVGREYPIRCNACCPRRSKRALTYAAEIAWQSVVAATFVLSHALYARATMMQKRTSLVDDTLTRVCRAPLNTAGCVKSHTGGAGTARNLTEAVLGAVATALAAPTNATGYKGECIDSLVDEVRAESARGAALGTFAAIVIGCVASGVGGLRAPFVLVVHALVVADSAIETLYSGWSNTYGCSEVTDYAAAVWPIVKLATAWLIFCISNRRSELLLRTQFVQMLRLKQMNLDSEVHLNPFSPALLARWMKKKRAKSGKRRASPSTLLRAARRTALLAGGHSVGDDLSDASDVDVNGSALSSPLSRSRARDPTSERTAVAPLALLGALGGSSMPQGRGHGRYASVDERLLRGSMHADRAMSTSSRGSNLRVGEGDSSGFGGLLPRLDSNYSQFHVPVSAALNRWDIPFTSIVQGRKISAGGSGQIYRAAFDGQPVAMKQLFSAMVTGDLDEFSREVSVLSSLGNHPNVLTLYGITKDDDSGYDDPADAVAAREAASMFAEASQPRIYIVTEWLGAGDLQDTLEKWRNDPVSNDCHVDSVVDIVLAVGSQVAAALAFLHKNRVLHGDLKPANVLMEGRRGYDEGDESTASESECAPERILSTARMVLSDFGLSSSTATRRRASRQEEAATRARKRESGGVLGSARKRTKGKAQTSLDAGALVNGKRVMGTHMYLAPELTLVEAELLVAVDSAGEHSAFAVAAAADVFALGIFLAAIARKGRPYGEVDKSEMRDLERRIADPKIQLRPDATPASASTAAGTGARTTAGATAADDTSGSSAPAAPTRTSEPTVLNDANFDGDLIALMRWCWAHQFSMRPTAAQVFAELQAISRRRARRRDAARGGGSSTAAQ